MTNGFFLSLTEAYAPHWREKDALRELVQNLFDRTVEKVGVGNFDVQQTDGGRHIRVLKKGDPEDSIATLEWTCSNEDNKVGTWMLTNKATILKKSAFLMGDTAKANSLESRGKFGEGLKTGAVALKRSGIEMQIHNGTKTWTVDFRLNPLFEGAKFRCLFIAETARKKGDQDDLVLEISGVQWTVVDSVITDCLLLRRPRGEMFRGQKGQLLFADLHRGSVYVKDLFVQRKNCMMAGVNLNDDSELELGRDRNVIEEGRLGKAYMNLWSEAVIFSPRYAKQLMKRLEDSRYNNFELTWAADHLSESANIAIAECWKGSYGDDAVPVPDGQRSTEHCDFISYVLQRKPIRVFPQFYNLLAVTNIDTMTTLSLRLRMIVSHRLIASGSDLLKDSGHFQSIKSNVPSSSNVSAKKGIGSQLPNDSKCFVRAITKCLAKVLGLRKEQILFSRVDPDSANESEAFKTGSHEAKLAVFAEPRLGKGRLVVAAPQSAQEGDEYHPAHISRTIDGGCWIDFGDGFGDVFRRWEQVAAPSSSREQPRLKIGTRVVCPWNLEKKWYTAKIVRVVSDNEVEVKWDQSGEPEAGTEKFGTEWCAFFLSDGMVLDRRNVFINLAALNIGMAHHYFGECVEKGIRKTGQCACIFRYLGNAVRNSLCHQHGKLQDNVFHFQLESFISSLDERSIDQSVPDFPKTTRKIEMQACRIPPHLTERSVEVGGLPKNWPTDVAYRSSLVYSDLEDIERNQEDTTIPGIQIEPIQDVSHPCFGELAVFATKDFAKEHTFGPYAGDVIPVQALNDSHGRGKYHMKFGVDDEFMVDAENVGNELRFVNDFRDVPGVSAPNVQFIMRREPMTGTLMIVLIAIKEVLKGNELLCDYGKAYWEHKQHSCNDSDKDAKKRSVTKDERRPKKRVKTLSDDDAWLPTKCT